MGDLFPLDMDRHQCTESRSTCFEDVAELKLRKKFLDNKNLAIKLLPYHIHVFTIYNKMDCLKCIFTEYPDMVNARYFGRTPLHQAVVRYFGQNMVSMLLQNNADVNARTCDCNRTALHLSFLNWTPNSRYTIMDLLAHQADSNALDSNGQSILMYCLKFTNNIERPWIARELLDRRANPFHKFRSLATGRDISVVDFIQDTSTLALFQYITSAIFDVLGIGFVKSEKCPLMQLDENVMKIIMNYYAPDRVNIAKGEIIETSEMY